MALVHDLRLSRFRRFNLSKWRVAKDSQQLLLCGACVYRLRVVYFTRDGDVGGILDPFGMTDDGPEWQRRHSRSEVLTADFELFRDAL